MADEPNVLQDKPPTFRAAMMNMNPKIALAFFLTTIAALMVLFLLIILVAVGPNAIDAGTIALIASMIMLFIKMAADANGYQTNSSAGSDKKDETSATVQKALADKVPAAAVPVAPAVPAAAAPWWPKLKNGEPAAITAAAAGDPKIMAFISAANVGAATPDDLAYLVTLGLLTQDRATAIQST